MSRKLPFTDWLDYWGKIILGSSMIFLSVTMVITKLWSLI